MQDKKVDTAALGNSRKSRISSAVAKRKSNLQYLKKAHEGGCFWMNIKLLEPGDVFKYVNSLSKRRTMIYYYWALSIEQVLDNHRIKGTLVAGISLVLLRELNQLMEEYEYFSSNTAMQGVRLMMARNSTSIYPQLSQTYYPPEDDQFKGNLYRFQNAAVFEFLKTPHISANLDHVEVVAALCDALCRLYDALSVDDIASTTNTYDTFFKIDERIKFHFIDLACKDLSQVALLQFKTELNNVRNSLGQAEGSS